MRLSAITLLFFLQINAGAQCTRYNRIEFCGPQWVDKNKMTEKFGGQFDFLKVQPGDTIVDIGAQSGWYSAAFSVATGLQNLHFVLVDIDTACLNNVKLKNMLDHYGKMQREPINNGFEIVNNTPDSLYVPLYTYKKVWLINTLHEIPDKFSFLQSISRIMKAGGEIIVEEIAPKKPGALHGGCKKPLLSTIDLLALFEKAGFSYKEKKIFPYRAQAGLQMIRFIKN